MESLDAPFAVDPEAAAALQQLWTHGHAAFVVGGAVRDALLGGTSADWDVATDARPDRLLEVFPGGKYENRFGTVRVGDLEITTFRRDHHYPDHRRPERVTFTQDVFEDLARRDLTINAIAWGRSTPAGPTRLVDPADGLGDLHARLVRAVGDPAARFDEDALRILRAIRIAAYLDFTIEPLTLDAIREHATDVTYVSGERIATELRRMLSGERPSRALHLLRDTGVLALVLPELEALAEGAIVARGRDASLEEPFEHALASIDVAAAIRTDGGAVGGRERLLLAALLHGIGQEAARAALARMRVGSREVGAVLRLAMAANVASSARPRGADIRRLLRRIGPDLVGDAVDVRAVHDRAIDPGAVEADELSRRLVAERARAPVLEVADLPVDGDDLRREIGLGEGPLVGRVLTALLDRVIEDPAAGGRDELLAQAARLARELAGPDVTGGVEHRVGSAE